MSLMPSGPLKEIAEDTLAFSTLLGNDDREKQTESTKPVSDRFLSKIVKCLEKAALKLLECVLVLH